MKTKSQFDSELTFRGCDPSPGPSAETSEPSGRGITFTGAPPDSEHQPRAELEPWIDPMAVSVHGSLGADVEAEPDVDNAPGGPIG